MRKFIFILIFCSACNSHVHPKPKRIAKTTSKVEKKISEKQETLVLDGELIDGPANIRDSANGHLLAQFFDSTVVTSTEAEDGWLEVGIDADLDSTEWKHLVIPNGSDIISEGRVVGKALSDIELRGGFSTNTGLKGELVGFTSESNIKKSSIVENSLADVIRLKKTDLSMEDFKGLMKRYKFVDFGGLLPSLKGFEIDENWIDDPSPLLRVWLFFENGQLFGIIHSRPIPDFPKTVDAGAGYFYSPFTLDSDKNKALIENFKNYLRQVD